jgi:hypothetical protein
VGNIDVLSTSLPDHFSSCWNIPRAGQSQSAQPSLGKHFAGRDLALYHCLSLSLCRQSRQLWPACLLRSSSDACELSCCTATNAVGAVTKAADCWSTSELCQYYASGEYEFVTFVYGSNRKFALMSVKNTMETYFKVLFRYK